MATTEQADAEQCLAQTDDGGRCSRPAQEDGFCYQHDESDPTVDEQDDGEAADGDASTDDAESADDDQETGADEDVGAAMDGDEGDADILDVRRTVEATAEGLIGHRLDGISEVSATEDGWRAIVEVVERSSVPDTQDILGQYEVQLSDDVEVQGYRRIDRYRRSDTDK